MNEKIHEVAIIHDPSWSTKCVRLLSTMEHPRVLLTPISLEVKEEVGQICDNKIIVTIRQLLKLALDLNVYLTTINK